MFSHQYLQLQPVCVVSDLLSIFTCNSILLPPLACDGPMWRNPHTPLGQFSAAPAQVDTQWVFVEWMSGWRKEKRGWKGGKIIILYGCWHCCFRSPWLINSIMTSMQQFKEMLTLSMYWYEEISRILNVKSKVTLVCALDCFCEKKEEKIRLYVYVLSYRVGSNCISVWQWPGPQDSLKRQPSRMRWRGSPSRCTSNNPLDVRPPEDGGI